MDALNKQELKNIAREFNSFDHLKLNELKAIAKKIGLKGYSRKTKPVLVELISEVTKEYREMQAKENAEIKEHYSGSDFDKSMLLKSYEQKESEDETARKILNAWRINYESENTIAKTKTAELRNIIKTIKFDYPDTSKYLDNVYQILLNLLAPITQRINKDYSLKVEKLGENLEDLQEIDGYKVINWAVETIRVASMMVNPIKSWYQVSLALAITSGRRMDEIHGDTCRFEIGILPNTLKAIGLSKKIDDSQSIESFCLVNPEQWLKVYNLLPESCKGLPNHKVNQSVSGNCCRALREIYKELSFSQYKDSRDFYIAFCTTWLKPKGSFDSSFIKKVIGHDSKRVGRSYEKMRIIGDCPINLDDYKEAITALF